MENRKMSKIQVISLGYLIIIIVGVLLLELPFATRSGERTDWMTAIFTATSATCVTGLVAADTFTYWSTFGQIIILCLIQLGGLGFMSIGIFLLVIFKKKIGLRARGLMQESVSAIQESGMVKLAKMMIFGTAIIEGTGALFLSFRFIPLLGPKRGIYYSIFHAVSAFCNAGFDLMGCFGEYSSLSLFYNDWYVNIIIMSLIVIGGLGFLVWQDILDKKTNFRKYRLHTKIVLIMTFGILVVTTLLFMLFERNNLMAGMSFGDRVLTSMFSSITARTAGFNTIDTGALTDSSKLLTILLMFIGGSPGSTAGGIKTTTVLVIFVYLWANMRDSNGCNIFGRRLDDEVIKRASLVFYINLFLALTAAFAIMSLESMNFIDILFEVFSAVGTAGMSAGITRDLCTISKGILIMLMYCGRVGSMTFAMSFIEKRRSVPIKLPVERITVG